MRIIAHGCRDYHRDLVVNVREDTPRPEIVTSLRTFIYLKLIK